MTLNKRILLFFVLPIIAVLLYPPETLLAGLPVIAVVIAFFIGVGIYLWRGRSLALTFAIFLQGMNVIIRLMMFFPNSISKDGVFNPTYAITCILGLLLSLYLVLRLDQGDVRVQMVQ